MRLDPHGITGPTRGEARSKRWRRISRGWYVDQHARRDLVEQRILEQSCRLGADGAVTGWASLCWRGGGFFDGTDGVRGALPVPLIVGPASNMRPTDASVLSWEQLAPWEREIVHGIACASSRRSLFDEVRRRNTVRSGVVAVDMALAAGLLAEEEFAEYVSLRPAWTGVPLVRKVLPLVDGGSMSPQESLLRLTWVLDAGLPPPLSNPDLVSEGGTFIGRPDLLDPESGLVGEYDGADHLKEDRRRIDRAREECFRDHGLEVVTVVRGEIGRGNAVAHRIWSAYQRARLSKRPQTWALAG